MGRGASGAEGCVLGGVFPSPIGVGRGEKAVPLPRNFCFTFWLKIVQV